MAAISQARATWSGDLASGSGDVTAISSKRFSALPISWKARTEGADGKTTPEELLAAAHASCFAMALSARLAKNATPAQRLEVTASVKFDNAGGGWGVASSELAVTASASGIDDETLRSLAKDAGDNCPISKALRGNVAISVTSKLAHPEGARS